MVVEIFGGLFLCSPPESWKPSEEDCGVPLCRKLDLLALTYTLYSFPLLLGFSVFEIVMTPQNKRGAMSSLNSKLALRTLISTGVLWGRVACMPFEELNSHHCIS